MLTLIRSKAEWLNYTTETASKYKLRAADINWGQGPQEFPCLVASVQAEERKIISCYVYPDAAATLVNEARLAKADQLKQHPEPDPPVPSSAVLAEDFNQQMVAMLLTVVSELVAIGATTEERFERELAAKTALVDRFYAEDKAALLAKLPANASRPIFSKLFQLGDE